MVVQERKGRDVQAFEGVYCLSFNGENVGEGAVTLKHSSICEVNLGPQEVVHGRDNWQCGRQPGYLLVRVSPERALPHVSLDGWMQGLLLYMLIRPEGRLRTDLYISKAVCCLLCFEAMLSRWGIYVVEGHSDGLRIL